MPTVEAERTKLADVVEHIAGARFAFPDEAHANWQTVTNAPERTMGIQVRSGGWIYPDILAVQEPGHFIVMLGVVTLRDEVTEEMAREHWLPLSLAGPLHLYVPAGQGARANRLCQQLGIKLAGLRVWKWTPRFGFEVIDAYSGPDVLRALMMLLPPVLRPRVYRPARRGMETAYGTPRAAGREGAAALAAPTEAALPLLEAGAEHAPAHEAHGSPFPILIGLGAAVTAFGVVFPAELLGAGLAITIAGTLGWLWEDVLAFGGAITVGAHGAAAEGAPGHVAPPSASPIVLALGIMLSAFGVVFPAELLGAGIALTVLGTLGWLSEDIQQFAAGH